MNMLHDDSLVALALTSRLVGSAVKPMSSREFRELRRRADPVNLLGKPASVVATTLDIGTDEAERIATLLDRGTGLAIALEKFAHSGIWTIADCGVGWLVRMLHKLQRMIFCVRLYVSLIMLFCMCMTRLFWNRHRRKKIK